METATAWKKEEEPLEGFQTVERPPPLFTPPVFFPLALVPKTCSPKQFACRDQITCISKGWRCDGERDCPADLTRLPRFVGAPFLNPYPHR